MSLSEYVSIVKNPYVNINGFNKSNCCYNLMLNGLGEWYCEEHHKSLGYGNEGTMKAMMYCQFYYRDHNCLLELSKKAAEEKAEAEKAEREKIEKAEKAEKEKIEKEKKALFEKRISNFDDIIQKNPNNAENYRLRGMTYGQRKMHEQAITDLNEAIRLDPNDTESYAYRGAVFSEKHEYDQAINDFNKAIQLNPKCKNAYLFRAAMYSEKKEYNKSISDYEEALQIDPNDRKTKTLLENVRRKKNEKQEIFKRDRIEKEKIKIQRIKRISPMILEVIAIILSIPYLLISDEADRYVIIIICVIQFGIFCLIFFKDPENGNILRITGLVFSIIFSLAALTREAALIPHGLCIMLAAILAFIFHFHKKSY